MAKHNKCVHCGTDIILNPSASQRAKNCRQGFTAQDYKNMFTEHAACRSANWYNKPNPVTANPSLTLNRV